MAKDEPQSDSGNPQNSGRENPFPVVAIGASAGGLEALETFFDNMPPDSGMSFIIIQHMAPGSKSMLGEILARHTGMRISEATEGLKIEKNRIYISPAMKEVSLHKNVFHLEDSSPVRLPIDYFFRSLAESLGEKAICIVLSGTGSDGTLGLRAIKESGGMAMVQEESQAKFDGMPRSGISTGLADHILPVERMARELISYAEHPYLKRTQKDDTEDKKAASFIHDMLILLRSRTVRDFTHYKQKTIRRRVERRMALHKLENFADYSRFLRGDPREIDLLSKEFLIGVTNFFRDPEAFESLKEKAIKDIVQRKANGSPVRVWVPGCATGEEALSLAMLFSECMDDLKKQLVLQIFAADIDQRAIERARAAEYPGDISADVSQERLRRFFSNPVTRTRSKVRSGRWWFTLPRILTSTRHSRNLTSLVAEIC